MLMFGWITTKLKKHIVIHMSNQCMYRVNFVCTFLRDSDKFGRIAHILIHLPSFIQNMHGF